MNRRFITGFVTLLTGLTVLGAQAFAQSPVNIHLVAGYAKGNDHFDIVVKDTPDTKLELYVDDKSPTKATVNKYDWATFHGVKLTGSGKISFTEVLKSTNNYAHQKPINYTQHYAIVGSKVQFSSNHPVVTPAVVTPAQTPVAPAPTTATSTPTVEPECTNGSYVNSDGNTVCSPETSSTVPAGATAQCSDGTYSFSQHRSGTCSGHGGVAQWL